MTQVFAKAPMEGCPSYITPGKEYLVEECDSFSFIDDDGDCKIAVWHGSAHLNDGNWTRIERDEHEAVSEVGGLETRVPKGWRLRQMNFSAPCADDRLWHVNVHGGREGEEHFVGRGSTPELAFDNAFLTRHVSPAAPPATTDRAGDDARGKGGA